MSWLQIAVYAACKRKRPPNWGGPRNAKEC
jgi:hypothetical protein